MPEAFPSPASLLPQVRAVLKPGFPQLGAAVSAATAAIVARHVQELRAQIESAAGLDDAAARDDLPEVLQALAQALESAEASDRLALCGPAHASARDGQRFTLEELLAEYVLVRQSLQTHARTRLGRELSGPEVVALHAAMDGLVTTTVASFTAQREARLKLECTALSDFLNSLAHDLRNEINGVMTSFDLLHETGTELVRDAGASVDPSLMGKLRDFVRDITAAREAMISSVSAMTRLLEIERTRTRVNLTARAVALLPLMQGVVRSASRGRLEEARSEGPGSADAVTITCPAGLLITTDPDLLGTVLVNLVGNAIKHAPGSPIRFSAAVLNDGCCRIEVRDAGPGIAAERIPHLFQRFERGEGRAPGVGLGLFVARRAAELLGSMIHVSSESGRGSCFALELPRVPPDRAR